ncbi:ammonium transporter [Micromonospora peucetia]|uniref:Ammonium transporter n=1 Tax=Micromonospora peucetia TaxID=47871 RepID=A0A1C6W3V5_9ACTN|nr:ammonium transporter [Micromonospora peucetia]MCX4390467.1 ammonium transporter [Micromonospora peucetia]SCL73094.1 ammonium transporter [Micromonospora peucetia]
MLAQDAVNPGDTAWVLVCAGLVLFMTPGLAIFYGGMVRTRNVLAMLQQNIIALGVVSLTWVLVGYTIAFGDDAGTGLFGNLELLGLTDLRVPPAPNLHVVAGQVTIPTLAFVAYQMMFAVITPALVTGATAGRLKFLGWAIFLAIWSIVVYAPVAHWLWHPDGWLANFGTQDWAGGMVVHASAGAAVLAVLLVVGRRRGWPHTAAPPNSIPLTILGAGILWFGWFGFNGGDGLQANGVAAQALINTHLAAAAGMLVWLVAERFKDGHSTVVGSVSGAVAGLATITPAAGYVNALSAIVIGAIAGIVCHTALRLKYLLRLDDALDVLAVHFVGGMLGSLLLGLFGDSGINPLGKDGLFFGGGGSLLWHQLVGVVAVVAFAFVLSWAIAAAVQAVVGLRAPADVQEDLDHAQQGAEAYHLGGVAGLSGTGAPQRRTGRDNDAARPAQPVQHARLVTATVDPMLLPTTRELRDALLGAGAASIVVFDATVSAAEPASRSLPRGYWQDQDLLDRARVEVVVEGKAVPAVLDVLSRYGVDRAESFVQDVQLATDVR